VLWQALVFDAMLVTACSNLQALQLVVLPHHVCNPSIALIISQGP